MNPNGRANPPGDLAQMLMMGQVDNLAAARHVSEQAKRFLGAKIVEGLHDVVGHERHRAARLPKLVISGNAQCEIELEARALRQLVRGFRAAAGGKGDQRLAILASCAASPE